MLLKSKKKVNAKAAQKEVERELSEDSLGQVAGGGIVLTGDPERDRQQIEAFGNLPHMQSGRGKLPYDGKVYVSPSFRGDFKLISSENE